MHARIAWGVLGLITVAAILDTAFTAAHGSLLSEATWADHGWPLAPLAAVGSALMGALIISRYPRQPLGWLLCVASLLSVTLAADAYSVWVLDGDGWGSMYWAHVAAWASPLMGWPAFTALIIVFLISPDGHLISPRWRWALWVTLAGLGLHTAGTLTVRPGEFVYGQQFGYRGISEPLLTSGVLLVAAGLVAAAASMVVRLRRARDDERLRLLWIASAAVFLAVGVVVILLVPRLQGDAGTWLAALPLRLAQVAVPLCVAVAVLRHRLSDIELIVNRALMFALAAGLVAVGYVSVVVVMGLAVGDNISGFWPSLLATAAMALAFQPLRRSVVKVADRLAFGPATVRYEALAEFSRRVGAGPDPAELLAAVAEVTAGAVGASRAVVVLAVKSSADRMAIWPPSATHVSAAAPALAMPIVDRGERLGGITVEMPAGHPLRTREKRLTADLIRQAGMAFRGVQLTAELSGEVEALSQRTDELAQSRRRLITAGDAERSRVERAIATDVLTHLAPVPERLRQLSDGGTHPALAVDTDQLAQLAESLNLALASLREITRGVFPAQLARAGLPTALGSLLARDGGAGRLVVTGSADGRRFDPRLEAAAYFCAAEASRAFGDTIAVALSSPDAQLRLVLTGRARGRLPLGQMRDRVEAAGGSLSLTEESATTVCEVRGQPAVAAPES